MKTRDVRYSLIFHALFTILFSHHIPIRNTKGSCREAMEQSGARVMMLLQVHTVARGEMARKEKQRPRAQKKKKKGRKEEKTKKKKNKRVRERG